MLAPLLGATLLALLVVALVASWRRSRALVHATHELRESHARRLLQERLAQENARIEHERAAFLAVPFLADACVMDLVDGESRLSRVAAVHADPQAGAALTERYRSGLPIHPVLAEVLRDGKAQQVSDPHPGLLLPLIARGRTLGVVSLFSYDAKRRFDLDMLDLVRIVRHPDGTISHLRGVMVDISESKRAELAQREGEEARRQAAALASVAALASAAAPEINNPLAIIQGNLEMFVCSADVSSAMGFRLDPMLEAVRRIAAIVGNMRRITRLESVPMPEDLPEMLDLRRCGGLPGDS